MELKIFSGKRICVAVSGGVDSTALLYYLSEQSKNYNFTLCAVHCEHGIRGEESKEDMRFVQALCSSLQVECFTFQENCVSIAKREKKSLETVAREFRKDCFARILKEKKVDFIATAHHLQDEAETVLFRLARGSSLTGAKGMKEIDGVYVRPFLTWKKEEIIAYAKEKGLNFRVDKTNFERDATRNKIRLDVLPSLENAVSGASENLAKFALRAEKDDEFLYSLAKELVVFQEKRASVAFSKIEPLFTRACLLAMKFLGVEKDYTSGHLSDLFALQSAERGAVLHLPFGVCAEKDFEKIVFYKREDLETLPPYPTHSEKFSKKGFDGGRYAVSVSETPFEEESEWKILRVDRDKIPQSAVFRFRKDGDKIEKFGGGTQTLKKFYNERKIPKNERAYLPIIAEEKGGEVYAVCGEEISNKVKITQDTKSVLYIKLFKNSKEKGV